MTRRQAASLGLAPWLAGCQTLLPGGDARAGLDLYLLAGQSNMAGRGRVAPEDMTPHPRVLALATDGSWQPAREPLHADKPAAAGVGPGRSFGIAMAEADPRARVGLVPCAVGGSPIASWEPGAAFEVEPGRQVHPLDDALGRAARAGAAGRWRGILWHQGESDSNEREAPLYEARLQRLLLRLRAALGDEGLPIVIGQMGRWPARPWSAAKEQVDQTHQRLARALGHAAFVGAEGLGLHDDGLNVHFDAAGARELGRRYAVALQHLRSA